MQKILIALKLVGFIIVNAQFSGNINYKTVVEIPSKEINVSQPNSNQMIISAKTMANVKADRYVAVFTVTQVGEDQNAANSLMDQRISESITKIKILPNVETFVDMVSFVPIYEYYQERKIFSKRTYNEIPTGFEIKKNIHISFSKPEQLSEFIKILANKEIYDLVRVDYFSTKLNDIKKEVSAKAKTILSEKIKSYELLSETSFKEDEKSLNEGLMIKYPVEMYASYEASSTTSLNRKANSYVNVANKNISKFYQPVFDKDYDFVFNPIVLEPTIQVLYEIKMVVTKKPQKSEKEYILISPSGDLKSVAITPKK